MSRLSRRWAAVVAAAALVALPASAAAAASVDDGLWYIDAFKVPAAWDSGLTGEGLTIAVIDTPLYTGLPALADADVTVREPSFCYVDGEAVPATSSDALTASHGTNVLALLAGNGVGAGGNPGVTGIAPDAKYLFYTAAIDVPEDGSGWDTSGLECLDENGDKQSSIVRAMEEAIDDGADIISISLGGSGGIGADDVILRAQREGVIIVSGVPNTLVEDFGEIWPGRANSVVAVNAIGADATVQTTDGVTNSFSRVTVAGPGLGMLWYGGDATDDWDVPVLAGGTSLATPVTAGFIGLVKQKYPDATSNQILQSLIHNTGTGNPDLNYDDAYGYGIVSLTTMLATDPSSYPDENPLIEASGDRMPLAVDFADDAEQPQPSASDAPTAEEDAPAADITPLVIGGVVIGLVVLAALIITIVVLARRRTTSPTSASRNSGGE